MDEIPFKKKEISSESNTVQIGLGNVEEQIIKIVESQSIDELIDHNNHIVEQLLKVEEEFKVINDRNAQMINLISSQQKTIESLRRDNLQINELLEETRHSSRKRKKRKDIKESDIISETYKSIEQQNLHFQKSIDSIKNQNDNGQIKQRQLNLKNSIDSLTNFHLISKRRHNIIDNYTKYNTEVMYHPNRNKLRQELDAHSKENKRLRELLNQRLQQQTIFDTETVTLKKVNESIEEINSLKNETEMIQNEINSCQMALKFSQFLEMDAQNSQFDIFSSQPYYISIGTMTDGTPLLNENDRQISKKIKDMSADIDMIKQDIQFQKDSIRNSLRSARKKAQMVCEEFDLTLKYIDSL